MIKRLLIANRGEIALRIIRACSELGIHSIAIYSDADRDSLHAHRADEAVHIGGVSGRDSYLNMNKIIDAARRSHAQAVHPGYGYLSENADFPQACEAAGILFVGPSPQVITSMGNKSMARKIMMDAGVPVIPGSVKDLRSVRRTAKLADELGYPVIVKAVAGGGGKGMRIVRRRDDLEAAFTNARTEADASFGNGRLYMEKYIDDARHVEIQVFGDKRGNVVHLGERECSIQRRYQKLIEESPSPAVDDRMRAQMGHVAVRAAQAVGYEGAGTVEFVVQDGNFYFIEMNTRIQVEHPVTELITGTDLVREQILVAQGEHLSWQQQDISWIGHSIECRINAEDTENNFMPSPGTVGDYLPPGGPGVRVDSHMYAGYTIPHYFDSLIAKLVVHAESRAACIGRMKRALSEYVIGSVNTTIPFHLRILDSEGFRRGDYTTKYIERMFESQHVAATDAIEPPKLPPVLPGAHGCFDESGGH